MIKRFNWAGMAENDPSPLWQASDFVKTTPGQVAAAGKMSHDRKRPAFLGGAEPIEGFRAFLEKRKVDYVAMREKSAKGF